MTDPMQDYENLGLEDFDPNQLSAPRIKIIHKDGVFMNTLTKEIFPHLDAIMLGLLKQRVYFGGEVSTDSEPFCKSPDGVTGFPNMNTYKPQFNFPWQASGFDPSTAETNDAGQVVLPCAACPFAQWVNRTPPPCAEQFTIPLIYNDSPDPQVWSDAMGIVSFQKSSMKPVSQYVSDFAQRRMPLFTAMTRISLTPQTRGSVVYAVPQFQKMQQLDMALFPKFAETFKMLRDYLRKPPRPQGAPAIAAAPQRAAIQAGGYNPAQPQYSAPVAAPAVAVAPPVVAAPAPAPAPVAAPTAAPAAPAPAAPAPAPEPVTVTAPAPFTAPAAPAAPPTPVQAAPPVAAMPPMPPAPASVVSAVPTAATPTAAAAPTTYAEDDDLPF